MNQLTIVREAIDALHGNVAVLDHQGLIIEVNQGWREFGRQRNASYDYVGLNYLDTCENSARRGDRAAGRVENGLRQLLAGHAESYGTAYQCGNCIFRMTARRLSIPTGGAIVAHQDITALMQARRERNRSRNMLAEVRRSYADSVDRAHEELAQRLTAISLAAGALERGGSVADGMTLIRLAVEEARHELRALRQHSRLTSAEQGNGWQRLPSDTHQFTP